MSSAQPNIRLNIKYLVKCLLFSLVFPMLVCILVDIVFNIAPFVTMVGGLLFIPISTFVVIRATLSEFDKVIQEVSPIEDISEEEIETKDDRTKSE